MTIPAVGTAVTFLIFFRDSAAAGSDLFFQRKTRRRACAAALAAFLFCSVFGNSGSFAFWEKDLIYEGESVYNYLQVKDTVDSVILSTNVLLAYSR